MSFQVHENVSIGTIKVLTGGALNLDFALGVGNTCVGQLTGGSNCTVQVVFTPRFAGSRPGAVQILDSTDTVIASVPIYGAGVGPQLGFAPGTLIKLPAKGIVTSSSIAVDGSGNAYVADGFNARVVKLPAGGGAQTTVPFTDLFYPDSIAVDGAGNLLAGDEDGKIVELLAGGGQTNLPFVGVNPVFVSVNGPGNVYAVDTTHAIFFARIVELPYGCLIAGCQSVLYTAVTNPQGMTVDDAGDIFVSSQKYKGIAELPAGGGAPILSPIVINGNQYLIPPVTLDPLGNIFAPLDVIIGTAKTGSIVEQQAGTGVWTTIAEIAQPHAVAVDGPGDIFVLSYTGAVTEIERSQSPPLAFGPVALGSTATLPLTITNTGTGSLETLPMIDNPSYTIQGVTPSNCLGGIVVGQTCTLQIKFVPPTVGQDQGTLTLQTNGATNKAVVLAGSGGVATPSLSLAPGVYSGAQTLSISDTSPGAAIYYTTNGAPVSTSSLLYTQPLTIAATERITAMAVIAGTASSPVTAPYIIMASTGSGVIDFGQGFGKNSAAIAENGSAKLVGDTLELTDGAPIEAGSAYSTTPVDIRAFTSYFTFQLTDPVADGITFTVQNAGLEALGGVGQKLGYGNIRKSIALKFDLYNNAGEGPNSTGLYTGGATPTVPATSLTGTGINLHSGDTVLARITYDGSTLELTLTDTVTQLTWSQKYSVDIPSVVGGDSALVGFTGSTGNQGATQQILSWTLVSGQPGPDAPPSEGPAGPAFASGFRAAGLTTNGSAAIAGTSLQLTSGSVSQVASAWFNTPVNIQQFTTDFSFQLTNPLGDGFTFVVQSAGLNAIGGGGQRLGYSSINKSVAVKFDFHDNNGEGTNSTGVYTNGTLPTTPATDLTGTGIDLRSGDPLKAHITYDGTTLSLTLTDSLTKAVWTGGFAIDIPPTVGSNLAYVGFTASTGTQTSTQQILDWTFSNP